ncbi:MAG: methyltransferase domain-containing protein [Tissierellaceae bacterium]|nr:methyltransferase domain-containing protein [Tissierellaceae bacterium]
MVNKTLNMISQKDFFNSAAKEWDNICKHDTNKIDHIINLLNIQKGSKILDVGTGTGILIPYLREKVGDEGKIIAIDYSDKMLEIAKKKYINDNVFFVYGDILETALPEEYFDFIICYSVFPHFLNKQLAISTMAKFLKTYGKLTICHSQSRKEINNLHKNVSEAVSEDNLPEMNVIKKHLKDSGLNIITDIDNDDMFVIIARK